MLFGDSNIPVVKGKELVNPVLSIFRYPKKNMQRIDRPHSTSMRFPPGEEHSATRVLGIVLEHFYFNLILLTSNAGFGYFIFSDSSVWTMIREIVTLRYHLWFAGMMYQGACLVLVWSKTSS